MPGDNTHVKQIRHKHLPIFIHPGTRRFHSALLLLHPQIFHHTGHSVRSHHLARRHLHGFHAGVKHRHVPVSPEFQSDS